MEVAGSRFGAVSAGRSRTFPVAQGFLSADPEGSPHGPVHRRAWELGLTLYPSVDAVALAHCKAAIHLGEKAKPSGTEVDVI